MEHNAANALGYRVEREEQAPGYRLVLVCRRYQYLNGTVGELNQPAPMVGEPQILLLRPCTLERVETEDCFVVRGNDAILSSMPFTQHCLPTSFVLAHRRGLPLHFHMCPLRVI